MSEEALSWQSLDTDSMGKRLPVTGAHGEPGQCKFVPIISSQPTPHVLPTMQLRYGDVRLSAFVWPVGSSCTPEMAGRQVSCFICVACPKLPGATCHLRWDCHQLALQEEMGSFVPSARRMLRRLTSGSSSCGQTSPRSGCSVMQTGIVWRGNKRRYSDMSCSSHEPLQSDRIGATLDGQTGPAGQRSEGKRPS